MMQALGPKTLRGPHVIPARARTRAVPLVACLCLGASIALSACGHTTQQATYEVTAPAGASFEVSWTDPDSPTLHTQTVSSGHWSRAVSGKANPLEFSVSATLESSGSGAYPQGSVTCKIVKGGSVISSGTGSRNQPANCSKNVSN